MQFLKDKFPKILDVFFLDKTVIYFELDIKFIGIKGNRFINVIIHILLDSVKQN